MSLLENLSNQWKGFLEEVRCYPLGYVVFSVILLIGIFILSVGVKESIAIFVPAWTAAFFTYKRARAVEQQMQTAEISRSNERFDRLCAMLDDGKETGQIGGLIGLNNLAREQTKLYRKNVFEVVCAFMRNKGKENEKTIQYAIDAFFKVGGNGNDRYFYEELRADLSGANLKDMNLKGVKFPGAIMDGAIFSNAEFSSESNFRGASLREAEISNLKEIRGDFTECEFQEAPFLGSYFKSDAILDYANFSGTSISNSNLLEVKSMEGTILPSDAYNLLISKHKNIVEAKNTT